MKCFCCAKCTVYTRTTPLGFDDTYARMYEQHIYSSHIIHIIHVFRYLNILALNRVTYTLYNNNIRLHRDRRISCACVLRNIKYTAAHNIRYYIISVCVCVRKRDDNLLF